MKMHTISPSVVADFFTARARRARKSRQQARLHRELARLPAYAADEVLEAIDQQRHVNFLD